MTVMRICIVGVWTLEQKGESPCFATTFDDASFSIGHLSLVALEKAGKQVSVITISLPIPPLTCGYIYSILLFQVLLSF